MGTDPKQFFEDSFRQLRDGRAPYQWQRKLFAEIVEGRWPGVVPLPTGAGKTALLYIWLVALAWSLKSGFSRVPRRLAWVVNRRVVVDQVTTEVQELLEHGLAKCKLVRDALADASVSGDALVASSLRGQLADNGDWARDPSTPGVVVGTVDMIGSRLLFRGYRSGAYHRPIHAGLLGVDTLIVNDEAHLSPAFARLLANLQTLRPAERVGGKSFRVMLLSATPGLSELPEFAHDPHEDAAENAHFRRVLEGVKRLHLHEVESKSFEGTVWKLATEAPANRTVIFLEQPEKAAAFHARLSKERFSATLLTGTMRGWERDQLAENDRFKSFLHSEYNGEPVFLVATSAGEVGINLTCDRMITGLREADHLLQRFGRLNRFGETEGEAHVVYSPPTKQDRLSATLDYLRSLDGDVSASNVWRNKPPGEACSELPKFARLDSRLLEMWSQTTYGDRHVPAVEPWLHGQQEAEAPEAEVAWRADLPILLDWGVAESQIEEVLKRYPVKTHEILREPARRLYEKLGKLAEREEQTNTWVLVVNTDGTVRRVLLRALVSQDAKERTPIDGRLVLLPPKVGRLSEGMLQAETPDGQCRFDVADELGQSRERRRYEANSDEWVRVGGPEERLAPMDLSKKTRGDFAEEKKLRPALVIRHPEDDGRALLYFGELPSRSGNPTTVLLDSHQAKVAKRATEIASKVGFESLVNTYQRSGELHDLGKKREVWQRAMGGSMEEPIAKTKAPANLRLIDGYRHELGSVVDMNGQSDDQLLLHLIASHHAAARPYFEERQYDRDHMAQSGQIALEGVRRFGRLQKHYGPWGLAYLEALFKAADGQVSAEEGEVPNE